VERKDLQELSKIRLKEAKALLGAGMSDGAYYLAGYAVECALKACIAKETKRYEFPDKKRVDSSYKHDLEELTKVAGLERILAERSRNVPEFRTNWEVVKSWSEQSRYQRHEHLKAEQLLTAASDRRHGVIPWIKVHW
jgi:HEPN domain-containing protein